MKPLLPDAAASVAWAAVPGAGPATGGTGKPIGTSSIGAGGADGSGIGNSC